MPTRRNIDALLVSFLITPIALADGGGGGGGGGGVGQSSAEIDPQYAAAIKAVEAKQYAQAIPLLESYVARAPGDAHAENYLGFSYRKLGKLDAAFLHYDKALAIDPKHRGAHEYIGEAYLMANNLAKAEEHLKILDRLCFFSCEEYRMLKNAIAAYKTGNKVAGR